MTLKSACSKPNSRSPASAKNDTTFIHYYFTLDNELNNLVIPTKLQRKTDFITTQNVVRPINSISLNELIMYINP